MKNLVFKISLLDKISAPLRKVKTTFDHANKAADKTNRAVKKLPHSIQGLNSKLAQLRDKQSKAFSIKGIKRYETEIRKTERELSRLNKRAGITKNSLGRMAVSGGVIYAAFRGIKNVVNLSADMEQTKVSFDTMLGSADGANKLISSLNTMANATPFKNTALYDNAKLLLNFGIKDAAIIPTLKMLGDVSGGSKDKLNRLTLAFSQVQSQGKLMGQDMLQMINAGFNPLQELSVMTGKSMSQLKDEMSKGAISADMVTQAFKHATGEGGKFHNMMAKQSQTLAGKWSTLIGKVQLMAVKLGNKLMPVITKFLDKIMVIADWIGKNINLITTVIGIIGTALIVFKAVTLAIKVWTGVQWLLNVAMTANPIGLIIVGVATFIALIVVAWKKSEKFRGTIVGLWEATKAFALLLKDTLVNAIKNLLSGIGKLGQALWAFFKGDYKKAWKFAKDGAIDVMKGTSIGVVSNIVKNKDKVTNAFSSGYTKGVNLKGKKGNSTSDLISNITGGGGSNLLDNTTGGGGGGGGSNSTVDAITGGGSKPTNITLNLGKFFDNLNINSTNIDEGINEMQSKVEDALLRVLNSANAISNG